MDEKTLVTLEFNKILDRLAGYASFSASAGLALAIRPTADLQAALDRQAETSEARRILDTNADVSIGGSTDIRDMARLAAANGVLAPGDLLAVKTTLIAARTLSRTFEKTGESYPLLTLMAAPLPPPGGLVDIISRAISERGEIMDSASARLGQIRSEMKVAYERLMSRLERIVNDPHNGPILQESIITQRNGRYVVPLRAEFKGRMRSIIHDQSASGATLFVEPLVIVELNNRWRELQLEERDEERRILADLSQQVGQHAGEIIELVEALAALDLAFMRAKYAEDLKAVEPLLVPVRPQQGQKHPGTTIRLYQARHPLLDPASVVPIDIDLDPQTYAIIITGPNTGGKTVTLKTVGLLAIMAQSGLHIPAQSGSSLSLFQAVFADIGDEQSIEQSLSTFSGHVTNLVHILARADRNSLVLLDELGAGTDPQEGSALAMAVLSFLLDRSITSLVATHYPELKAYAHSTPGVVNASVEFDLQTLRPTYHLVIGLPGRSNALSIAERLGLLPEIIQAARSSINPDDLRAEDLLDEIHRQRDIARKARAEAEKVKNDTMSMRGRLAARLEQIEDERRKILEKAQADAEQEAARLRDELDVLRRELARAHQPLEVVKSAQDRLEQIEERVERPVERKARRVERGAPLGPMRLGEKVRLRSLNADGVVTSLSENEAEVQVGALRVRARLSDIERKGEQQEEVENAQAKTRVMEQKTIAPFRPSPGIELDIRGQRAEDALDALESYIESAYLAGLPFVRIIHGKGTGKLRDVVRQWLRESQQVRKFENGQDKEGGEGVTVVKLETE